jgi:hypothetical protein
MDTELPILKPDRMDKLEPMVAKLNTESAEPNRAKLRMLTLDPTCANSSIET